MEAILKMGEKNSIIIANLTNLTSLWKTVSIPFQSYFANSAFEYCEIKNSDWPNRLWFNQDPSRGVLDKAIKYLRHKQRQITLPYWDVYASQSYDLVEKMGFGLQFEQIGMSMKLSTYFSESSRLTIKMVTGEAEAKLWEETFTRAFGYLVNKEILVRSFGKITYYLAYNRNKPIGTAVVFATGKIVGIHGIGVVQEERRKGFADQIMRHVLNKSTSMGSEYVTLQASMMGKGLYLKLGFEEDFRIRNYTWRG